MPSAAACGRTAGSRYSGSSSGVASFDFRCVQKTSTAGTSGARECPTVTCSTERENSSIATRTPSSSWLGTKVGSRSGSTAASAAGGAERICAIDCLRLTSRISGGNALCRATPRISHGARTAQATATPSQSPSVMKAVR